MGTTSERRIGEAEFLGAILECAKVFGWRVCHFRPAWTAKGYRTPVQGDAGFPDLVLCRGADKRLAFIEVKSDKGKLLPKQKEWLDDLKATGRCEVYCWRPTHWDAIVSILRKETNDG